MIRVKKIIRKHYYTAFANTPSLAVSPKLIVTFTEALTEKKYFLKFGRFRITIDV